MHMCNMYEWASGPDRLGPREADGADSLDAIAQLICGLARTVASRECRLHRLVVREQLSARLGRDALAEGLDEGCEQTSCLQR